MRHEEQNQASKNVLSAELQEIRDYIENYQSTLSEEVLNSPEYSIKLIPIPKISNTNRSDQTMEFARADQFGTETSLNQLP